jgi:hypothetical protein
VEDWENEFVNATYTFPRITPKELEKCEVIIGTCNYAFNKVEKNVNETISKRHKLWSAIELLVKNCHLTSLG